MLDIDAGTTVSTEAVVVRCRARLSYISVGMTTALLLTLNSLDNKLISMFIIITIVTLCGDLLIRPLLVSILSTESQLTIGARVGSCRARPSHTAWLYCPTII